MTLNPRQKVILAIVAVLLIGLIVICSTRPKKEAVVSEQDFYYEEQTHYAPPAGHQPMYDSHGQVIHHYYPGMVAYRTPELLEQVIMTKLMLDAFSPVDYETNARLNRLERERQYNEYRNNPREFRKNYGDPKAKRDPKRRAKVVSERTRKKTNKSSGIHKKPTAKKPASTVKKKSATKPGDKPTVKKPTTIKKAPPKKKPAPKPKRRSSSSRRRR